MEAGMSQSSGIAEKVMPEWQDMLNRFQEQREELTLRADRLEAELSDVNIQRNALAQAINTVEEQTLKATATKEEAYRG